MTILEERYEVLDDRSAQHWVCKDQNLNRPVRIHWVGDASLREAVRTRLATLQLVRSPYIALIYDLVEIDRRIGIVEEELTEDAEVVDANRLLRLYQFCAGLAALHESGLAHGALESHCFRATVHAKTPRLCNLAFGQGMLSDLDTDRIAVVRRLAAWGVGEVIDTLLQNIFSQLTRARLASGHLSMLRDRLAALLLKDKHRALVHWRGTRIELGAENRHARLSHPAQDITAIVRIEYDGTRFFLAEATGEVLVNNRKTSPEQDLPSSCVIALGESHRPASMRYFVTFDQSHPEVFNAAG